MTQFQANIAKRNLYPVYNGISRIIDECKLNITETGILVDEIDLANVCQVSVKLPRELFEQNSYQYMNDQIIGIDLTKYQKIIDKDLDDNTIFKFKLIESQMYTNPQLITRINRTEYKHTTLDPVTIRKSPKPFEIKYPLGLTVPLEFLIEGIGAVDKIQHEFVLIGVDFNKDDSTFFIRSSDDDGSNTEIRLIDLTDSKWINKTDQNESVIQSLYSMDYVREIIKGLSASKEISNKNVMLKLGNDWPIEISVESEFNDEYELKYILGPRIYCE